LLLLYLSGMANITGYWRASQSGAGPLIGIAAARPNCASASSTSTTYRSSPSLGNTRLAELGDGAVIQPMIQ
jgi:hypothetical protein